MDISGMDEAASFMSYYIEECLSLARQSSHPVFTVCRIGRDMLKITSTDYTDYAEVKTLNLRNLCNLWMIRFLGEQYADYANE